MVSSAEMERMMKVQEVILKAMAGKLKWCRTSAQASLARPDHPLGRKSLAVMRRRFAQLSLTGLYATYDAAWLRCKVERNGRAPRAECMQESCAGVEGIEEVALNYRHFLIRTDD
jgi:hypothetical protein